MIGEIVARAVASRYRVAVRVRRADLLAHLRRPRWVVRPQVRGEAVARRAARVRRAGRGVVGARDAVGRVPAVEQVAEAAACRDDCAAIIPQRRRPRGAPGHPAVLPPPPLDAEEPRRRLAEHHPADAVADEGDRLVREEVARLAAAEAWRLARHLRWKKNTHANFDACSHSHLGSQWPRRPKHDSRRSRSRPARSAFWRTGRSRSVSCRRLCNPSLNRSRCSSSARTTASRRRTARCRRFRPAFRRRSSGRWPPASRPPPRWHTHKTRTSRWSTWASTETSRASAAVTRGLRCGTPRRRAAAPTYEAARRWTKARSSARSRLGRTASPTRSRRAAPRWSPSARWA